MKKYFLIISLIFISLNLNCNRESPELLDPKDEKPVYTEIKGYISENFIFTDSPYKITEDIYIDSLKNILIDPGVELHFSHGTKFYLFGNLFAAGTKEKQIKFTGYLDSTWDGIKIMNSDSSEFSFCVIEKINIEDDDTTGIGSVRIEGSNVKFSNCTFEMNKSTHGGAIYTTLSSCIFKNCIFNENFSVAAGGAILSELSSIEVVNNTFFKNSSFNFGGGIVLFMCESFKVYNNIFYKNSSQTGDPRIVIVSNGTATNDTAYNFLAHGNLNPGFKTENDFHLKEGSPCIDAGSPEESYNDFNGSRNDQGAYGGPSGNW